MACSVGVSLAAAALAQSPLQACATFDIDQIGAERLGQTKSELGQWLELGDVLFACGPTPDLLAASAPRLRLWRSVDPSEIFLVRAAHPGNAAWPEGVAVLARSGPHAVVHAATAEAQDRLGQGQWHAHLNGDDGCQRSIVSPYSRSLVLARQSANSRRRGTTTFGLAAAAAAGAVDAQRWFADVETLASWNRYTHGSQIDDASAWLEAQFSGLGLPVTTPTFSVSGTIANNVIATWTGVTRPNDWYLVGAHYDSTSQNPGSSAPGAEDNASGCAGVLELARVLVPRQPEATIIFVCYSGEEQGLHGSEAHAGAIVTAGDASKLQNIVTMDMIGYTGDADLDVLLETAAAFNSTLDVFEDAAAAFTSLRTVRSLNPFGSDHMPFLNRGLPALLTIENDWDSYPGYHSTTDLPANLSQAMGGGILQMNAAVLAEQAGAGTASGDLLFADGFEDGTTTSWN